MKFREFCNGILSLGNRIPPMEKIPMGGRGSNKTPTEVQNLFDESIADFNEWWDLQKEEPKMSKVNQELFYIQVIKPNEDYAYWISPNECCFTRKTSVAKLFTKEEAENFIFNKPYECNILEADFVRSLASPTGFVLVKDLVFENKNGNNGGPSCEASHTAFDTSKDPRKIEMPIEALNDFSDTVKRSQKSEPPIDLSILAGKKHDQGKPDYSLLPVSPIRAIVEILTFGVKKYSRDNWQQVSDPINRYTAALMRHIEDWRGGQKYDPETGKNHLAHAGCCLLFLLWFELKGEKS